MVSVNRSAFFSSSSSWASSSTTTSSECSAHEDTQRRAVGRALRRKLHSATAFAAFEPFVVRNFRVEGAQRIAEGTIYNYLPINIGDTVDERRLREAGRAMFQTASFRTSSFAGTATRS